MHSTQELSQISLNEPFIPSDCVYFPREKIAVKKVVEEDEEQRKFLLRAVRKTRDAKLGYSLT